MVYEMKFLSFFVCDSFILIWFFFHLLFFFIGWHEIWFRLNAIHLKCWKKKWIRWIFEKLWMMIAELWPVWYMNPPILIVLLAAHAHILHTYEPSNEWFVFLFCPSLMNTQHHEIRQKHDISNEESSYGMLIEWKFNSIERDFHVKFFQF